MGKFFGTATIETDNDAGYEKYSVAPLPSDRLIALRNLDYPRKFVSVEPIMDFTNFFAFLLSSFSKKLEFVYVGYDNHCANLPEPPLQNTLNFIAELRKAGIEVREKTIRAGNQSQLPQPKERNL